MHGLPRNRIGTRRRARREAVLALALLVLATVTRLLLGGPATAGGPELAAAGGPEVTTPHPQPQGLTLSAAPAYGGRGLPCYGEPARGSKHFRVFYAHLDGTQNRVAELRDGMRADLARTDDTINASAARTGGVRHLRLDTGVDCVLRITPVTFPGRLDPIQTTRHLVTTGQLVGDEKAIVFTDWTPDPAGICGWSEIYADDQAGVRNRNNYGSSSAVTFIVCLNQGTTGHEVMHTLGGVQNSAPHATGGFHCTDEYDRMCYADRAGATMTYPCGSRDGNHLFDCNADDFFSISPPSGSYLATHWNVANSDYWERADPPFWDTNGTPRPLAPEPAMTPTPTPTATQTPAPDPGPTPTPTPPPLPDPPSPDPPPPPPPATVPGFDGDARTTERVDEADASRAAVAISQLRFASAGTGGRSAAHAVLSRDDDFPDSLAGAALTDDGPLLLTSSADLSPAAAGELRRLLAPGGTVYLLGGEAALSSRVADAVTAAGFRPVRLAGASRIETAIAIADEVRRLHPGERRVAVARAFGPASNPTAAWADAVTGGAVGAATGVPTLIVPTEQVPVAVATWLAAARPSQTILYGGVAALSPAVESAVPNPLRVSGSDRAGTAARVATTLWPTPASRHVLFHGFRPDGWAFGLAAAGLAADAQAPLLVLGDDLPAPTADLLRSCGTPRTDLLLVGSAAVLGNDLVTELDRLDGSGC